MPKNRNTVSIPEVGIEHIDGSPPSSWHVRTALEQSNMYAGDTGHYGYPNFPDDRNVGGAFLLKKYTSYSDVSSVGTIWRGGPLNQYYTGGMVHGSPDIGAVFSNADTSDSWASDAYSKMKPAQPKFQALNAIYELRELPGQLRQRFLSSGLKAIPNYWLALQFGWKPLLNDIRNYVITQMKSQDTIKQLLRDNGRPVRRRIKAQEAVVSEFKTSGAAYAAVRPVLVTNYYPKSPTYQTTVRETLTHWASAEFKYWLPEGPRDVNWTNAMKARIFGLNPSPSVVWNALPWTWLIDWHVDIGTMLSNMDAGVANRLAARHFYIMAEWKRVGIQESQAFFLRQNGENVMVSGSGFDTAATMSRIAGSPFGWNVNETGLSGMQLSILGSLGMSRLRP